MDALDRREIRNLLMDRLGNQPRQTPNWALGALKGGAYAPMMQTASQPTAAEESAWNERNKNRQLYGRPRLGVSFRDRGGMGIAGQEMNLRERLRQRMEEGLNRRNTESELAKNFRERIGNQSEEAVARTQAAASRDVAGTQANKPQYHYGEITGPMGQTAGFQVFKNGQPIRRNQLQSQPMNVKGLEEGNFELAAEIFERRLAGKSPDQQQTMVDQVFLENPKFGKYLRNRGKKSETPKAPVNETRQTNRNTLGSALTNPYAFRKMGNQFMKNLSAPTRLAKDIMNAELPDWLR